MLSVISQVRTKYYIDTAKYCAICDVFPAAIVHMDSSGVFLHSLSFEIISPPRIFGRRLSRGKLRICGLLAERTSPVSHAADCYRPPSPTRRRQYRAGQFDKNIDYRRLYSVPLNGIITPECISKGNSNLRMNL